jgi:hypothetical protein
MIRVSLAREAVNGFREAVWPSRWMYPPSGFQPCASLLFVNVAGFETDGPPSEIGLRQRAPVL